MTCMKTFLLVILKKFTACPSDAWSKIAAVPQNSARTLLKAIFKVANSNQPGSKMGFSKKTGKGRLDKYYYLAKEHGYRARSAFKIKQLNQKFGFLEKARVLLDLCAAPGGWLQVAAESMPMSHVIVGVDLVPIKPIKGVTTIVGDITTEKCRSDIKKELKDWKADVVLHDGAPNVGNSWIQDAFSQAELALHSFKLASEFLIEGGVFVTKVFRSKEYPLVLAALKKYFKKVEATKPDSSRSVSAEIFVYCKGFQTSVARSDPVNLREILSGSQELSVPNAITNILHPEKKRVNRDGYEDNVTILHKTVSLLDFLNSKTPDQVLASNNAIIISTKDEEDFLNSLKDSSELRLYCSDLKVIGRKEFKALLKAHKIFQNVVKDNSKSTAEHEEEESPEPQSDDEQKLFNEYKSQQRALKKKEKKSKRRMEESKNHMDLSYDQSLQSEMDNHANVSEDLVTSEKWFSNPVFNEVLEAFTDDLPRKVPNMKNSEVKRAENSEEKEEKNNNMLPPVDPDELIDISFNRYAFDDDKKELPTWFVEDEQQHNVPQEPITKEIADLMRENERVFKNRLPKKVLEAKNRQKMKALRKLQTLKKKASAIAENEDIGEGQKVAQIRKLLSKAKVERNRPKVVVAKGKLKATNGRPKGVKGKYKMVDRRMLKDMRALKSKNSK